MLTMPRTTPKLEKTEARRPYPPSASVGKSEKGDRHGNDRTSKDDRDSQTTPPPAYVIDSHHRTEKNVHEGISDHKRHHKPSLPGPLPEWSGRDDPKQKCHRGRHHHGHHHRFRRHHNSDKPGEEDRGRHSRSGKRGGWRRGSSTSSSSGSSSTSSDSSHEKARQVKESLKQMVRRIRGKM